MVLTLEDQKDTLLKKKETTFFATQFSPINNTPQLLQQYNFNLSSPIISSSKPKKMAYYSDQNSQPSIPLHLCFFLLTLFMFLGFSWYLSYENIFETLIDQVKLVLMISPILLLLVLHLLSNYGDGGMLSSFIPLPERDSLHRAGGTPWGVGLLLVVLFFMISYHSSFQERWFPLLSR
ncbi:hypothetical protein RIF29_38252 [Crotalaria pallida]|uniref:Transmembrane protein n=1 Tax=Crotalaria pallida TaxID=3830 RepID=A0AAN9DZT6_CROPI